MKSAYRIGLPAALGTLIVAGAAVAVSALSSPAPARLPSDPPVTLQTRSNDDGSFTAPPPSESGAPAGPELPGPGASTEVPTQTTQAPATPTPAAPLSTQPPKQVDPPVDTYPAPQPQPDDDADDGGDDDDVDDDDDD